MPIRISSRPLGQPLTVMPRMGGGYQRAQLPNPNDAGATYRRTLPGLIGGLSIMRPMMASASSPFITPTGESALSRNVGLATRAREQAAATAAEEDAMRGPNAMRIRTVATDPTWAALLQALAEQGTDRLTTGAARGWDGPGFFETQADPQAQQNRLAQLLADQDAFEARYRALQTAPIARRR